MGWVNAETSPPKSQGLPGWARVPLPRTFAGKCAEMDFRGTQSSPEYILVIYLFINFHGNELINCMYTGGIEV